MNLDDTLVASENAHRAIWDAFHGPATSLGPKTVPLFSYTTLALEHNDAIVLMVRNGLYGSALALARPVMEIMWHAGWANAFASDDQIEEILNGRFRFPKARHVVEALDEHYQMGDFFREIHRTSWGPLNGFTHSGKHQLLSRFTDTEFAPSYPEELKIRAVTSSLTAAGMTAILTLKAHGRIEKAAKVEQILLSTANPSKVESSSRRADLHDAILRASSPEIDDRGEIDARRRRLDVKPFDRDAVAIDKLRCRIHPVLGVQRTPITDSS
jgi:hypothetical protein